MENILYFIIFLLCRYLGCLFLLYYLRCLFSVGRTKRKRNRKGSIRGNLGSDSVIVSLSRWMKSNGWENICDVNLRDFDSTGRGIFSKKSIKQPATLIQIPYDLMITYSMLHTSEISNIILKNANKSRLLLHDLLALFLVFERHKDSKSEWKHYLDSLPQKPPPLLFMSDLNEIGFLPETVKDIVLPSRWKFEESWKRALESIAPSWKCVCCRKERDRVFTFDSFSWGYAMVNTRAVYIDPQTVKDLSKFSEVNSHPLISDEPCMALCPYLDMFNHSCDARTEAELKKNISGWVYELRTLTPYKKYEQIFISYGAHDNVKLLCEYGFFLPGNKFDRICFSFKVVSDVLHVKLNGRQYRFIMDKSLNSDLHISSLGLSFNLKAMLLVAFWDDIGSWNTCIFSENYSKDMLDQMMKCGKSLLKSKMDDNVDWLRRLDSRLHEFSTCFLNIVEYIKYENILITSLMCNLVET